MKLKSFSFCQLGANTCAYSPKHQRLQLFILQAANYFLLVLIQKKKLLHILKITLILIPGVVTGLQFQNRIFR